jgi:hypothetical protein
MSDVQRKIEFQAQQYMRLKEEKDLNEMKMDQTKVTLQKLMNEAGEHKVLIPWNEEKDIKVELTESRRKKLDKEQMADDFQIAADTIKTELLLKLVEDGKLTLEDYRRYMYDDINNSVSIRLVKAD